jgi:MFS family permease
VTLKSSTRGPRAAAQYKDVMIRLRDLVADPWRAVPVLGLVEIIAWGSLIYPPVLTAPLIAAERGWSLTFAMGGFSLGLFAAGLISPLVGRMIDRHGGHVVMPVGLLVGACGLLALTQAAHPAAYLAAWIVIGAAMAATLYDAAFASLARLFGAAARRPLTAITLAGGFASTVSWPFVQGVLALGGWRAVNVALAAALAFVAAPLIAFALPRKSATEEPDTTVVAPVPVTYLAPRGTPFILVASAFAIYAFVPSALAAHMLAIFARAGIDASTVVLIGMTFGPAQVTARICELTFGHAAHPLRIACGALVLLLVGFIPLALFGVSAAAAVAFALAFGIGNGLMTLARGAVPLTLFGARGYGHLMGRIAGPSLVIQSAAPLVLALVAERAGDALALGSIAIFALGALACLVAVRPPESS